MAREEHVAVHGAEVSGSQAGSPSECPGPVTEGTGVRLLLEEQCLVVSGQWSVQPAW